MSENVAKRSEIGSENSDILAYKLIPLRLSLFFKKVVVCGHSLVVTLSLTINETLKYTLLQSSPTSIPPPPSPRP